MKRIYVSVNEFEFSYSTFFIITLGFLGLRSSLRVGLKIHRCLHLHGYHLYRLHYLGLNHHLLLHRLLHHWLSYHSWILLLHWLHRRRLVVALSLVWIVHDGLAHSDVSSRLFFSWWNLTHLKTIRGRNRVHFNISLYLYFYFLFYFRFYFLFISRLNDDVKPMLFDLIFYLTTVYILNVPLAVFALL